MNPLIPPYTGTIALIVGLVVIVLQFFGVVVAPTDADTIKAALGGICAALPIVIGIWRLLFTKKAVTTLSNQVVALGATPQAGPARDTVPTQASIAAAQSAVRKESRNA